MATVPKEKAGAPKKRLARLIVRRMNATNQTLQQPPPLPSLPLLQHCQNPWKRIALMSARIQMILSQSPILAAPTTIVAVRSA